MNYSLAINSRVALSKSASLSRPAYSLGKQIAAAGHTALTPAGLSLAYQVARGAADKSGLSIGFSPAAGLRQHVNSLQLPTDVYDWLHFTGLGPSALLAELIQKSQALVLVGAVMANISELALASDASLPVGVLLDSEEQANNDLLQYLQSLPLEKQRHIVVHKDPKTLLDTVAKMLDEAYADLDQPALEQNNQFFGKLLKEVADVPEPAD
ncbi:hypothetical protein F4X86_04075 [Candidatus Saccharibacteria bacterium]|nr:hypothetical protein [Candidatus Saccharibacteria bacterium]